MPRRALIVRGAAGSDATAADVLQQRDFVSIAAAVGVDDALGRMQRDHFDLVIVPVAEMEPVQFQTLARAVQRAQSTFLIGTATHADPDLMLRGFRSGIHEFLLVPLDATEFGAAIDRLMQRSKTTGEEGMVVAVYSAKGGVGTTTVAVNLAHALASTKPEREVVLADMVTGSGDVRVHLNVTPAYDRSDLLPKLDRIDTDLLRSVLTMNADGLWVLPGPDATELNGTLDGTATAIIIGQVKQDFAFAVLDCEHYLGDGTVAALEGADRVLVVTDLSIAALRNTQRALLVGRRLGLADDKFCVVVNRSQASEVLTSGDAEEALKREIFWEIAQRLSHGGGRAHKRRPDRPL